MEKKMKNESLRFWSFVAWAIMALLAITGGIVVLGYLNYFGAICCFALAAAAFAGAWLMYPEGEVKVVEGAQLIDGAEMLAKSISFSLEGIKTDRLIALNVTRQKWRNMRLQLFLKAPLLTRINVWMNSAMTRCAACWYRREAISKLFPYGIYDIDMCKPVVIEDSGDTFEGCEFQSVCEEVEKTREKVLFLISNRTGALEKSLTLCKRQTDDVIALLDKKIARAKFGGVETFRVGDGKKTGENLQAKGERDGTDKKKEKETEG